MLPTIMSQMGMSTDSGLGSEGGRRKFGAGGDQQQSGNEQTGAANDQADDEEVPGMSKENISFEIFFIFYLKILWKILMTYQTQSDYYRRTTYQTSDRCF